MFDGRKLLLAVIGGLLIAAAAEADMVPVFEPDAGCHHEASTRGQPETPPTDSSCPYTLPDFADLEMHAFLGFGQIEAGDQDFHLCLSYCGGEGLDRGRRAFRVAGHERHPLRRHSGYTEHKSQ